MATQADHPDASRLDHSRPAIRWFLLAYPLVILAPILYVMFFDPNIPDAWGSRLFYVGFAAASLGIADAGDRLSHQVRYDVRLFLLLLRVALVLLYFQFFRLGVIWATRLPEVQPLEPVVVIVLLAIGLGCAWVLGLWRFWFFGLGDLKEPIEFVVVKTVAAFVVLTELFAALSAAFIHWGWSVAEPAAGRQLTFRAVEGYYYWHLFDQLPQLDIPKAFHWESTLTLNDPISGALLVLFKVLVIIPVIGVLLEAYKRFRPRDQEVLRRLDRIESLTEKLGQQPSPSMATADPVHKT